MEVHIRLAQGRWREAWWILLMHAGALVCLALTSLDVYLTAGLALAVCVAGWRTCARHALRRRGDSVVGVHVKQGRIAGLTLGDGRYVKATGRARLTRLGILDVVMVPVTHGAARELVFIDAHQSLDDADRHLLRFATRPLGGAPR